MNASRMKNIIVLKDLPSNFVDEAIVVLKSGVKIKNKEIAEAKHKNNFRESVDSNYQTAIKEAEFIVQDYITRLEKPNDNNANMKKMRIQYKKLQICSLMLGFTTIIGICVSIFK